MNEALRAFERIIDDYNHGLSVNRTVTDHRNDLKLVRKALTQGK